MENMIAEFYVYKIVAIDDNFAEVGFHDECGEQGFTLQLLIRPFAQRLTIDQRVRMVVDPDEKVCLI